MLFVLGVVCGSLGTAAAFILFRSPHNGLSVEQNARLDRADQILRERYAEVLASNKTGPAACRSVQKLAAEQDAAPLQHSISI